MNPSRSERSIVLLIGAVQFINILDFMIVMPLGPDFARALGIATSKLGYIGGSYTAAAAITGFLGSFFLDRFDRKKALIVSALGLAVGTALGGLATSFPTLMLARIVAGAFGGPATSVAFSIIADVIPAERRGRAMGTVMGAFAVASIAGVPAGLELARLGTWQTPFFAVAGTCAAITGAAALLLPPMTGHLAGERKRVSLVSLVRPRVLTSYLMTALVMCAGFIIIPNISAYLQGNLHFPRDGLSWLYFMGGFASFATTQTAGRMVDRFGSLTTVTLGVALLCTTIYLGFIAMPPPLPVAAVFIAFMVAMGFRNVGYNTLTSKVPSPQERAQFMSMQSCVQHLASAGGAFLSSKLLTVAADQSLIGMTTVASVSIGMSLVLPFVVGSVERGVRQAPK